MNGMMLYEAMGRIRPVWVEEAEKQSFAKPLWRRMLPMAACLTVLLGLSAASLHWSGTDLGALIQQPPQAAAPGAAERPGFYLPGLGLLLGLLVLGTAVLAGKSRKQPELRSLLPGLAKFWVVLGLQLAALLPFAFVPSAVWLEDTLHGILYKTGLLSGQLAVYIGWLQKAPHKRASWSIPLGVALFPVLAFLMTRGRIPEVLLELCYVPCQLVTLTSTAVLKYQSRKGI